MKRAGEKKKDHGSNLRVMAEGVGAATLATPASVFLAELVDKVDTKWDAPQVKRYLKDVSKEKGMPVPKWKEIKSSDAWYMPSTHTIAVSNPTSAGVLAHEAGHAASFKSNKTYAEIFKSVRRLKKPLERAAMVAPALGLMSDNEKVQKAAPYLGGAILSPILLEELMASTRGTMGLAKHRGLKAALRNIPGRIADFATYAAIPAASGYIAHRAIKKRREALDKKKNA